MEKMTLGGYTFARNPVTVGVISVKRSTATVETYSGYMFFSYGLFTDGQKIDLEWDYMTEEMFDILQILLEQDTSHNWNPQTGTSYIVQILTLDGQYFESSLEDAPWRKKVKLSLLLRSEAI